jgi:hypothetical protein
MLAAARGAVSSGLLRREACEPYYAVPFTRAHLRRLGAPEGIISVHRLGYRITPELRAWIDERVAA